MYQDSHAAYLSRGKYRFTTLFVDEELRKYSSGNFVAQFAICTTIA